MRIVVNPKACYGCRACELVCAYHHRGVFSPGGGSIKVDKDNQSGTIRLSVDSTCNLCQGKDQPLCIQYCSYNALRMVGKTERK
jgi:Fe-S-cluster-containing hydrogenase component 2